MNKNTLGRFPSLRNHLQFQRRSSKDATLFSNKEQLSFVDAERKIQHQTSSTIQNEAKKIQKKIKIKKHLGSDKKFRDTLNADNCSSQNDPLIELKDKIDQIWQNSHQIYEAMESVAVNASRGQLKQLVIKQASMILCQISGGQELQTIIVERLKKKLNMLRRARKCQQKQQLMMKMFNDRLQQLSLVFKMR